HVCDRSRQQARGRGDSPHNGADVVWPHGRRQIAKNDRGIMQTRARNGLGHAHHLEPRTKIQWWRISLRLGVAAIHWLGFSGRISLSQAAGCLRQLACERLACVGWVARSRHRSFVRGLLPATVNKLTASDLVGGEPSVTGSWRYLKWPARAVSSGTARQ